MQFTPLKDFYSKETRSQYVTGLSYFCKDDADHAVLKSLLPKWIAEGLVRVGPPTAEEIQRHLPGDREHQVTSDSVLKGEGGVK
ncbi:MAG TPA: hypothetical protein VN903_27025 [Polyangia bacterium]|nr:hypothetical protein [Polyangia bacterium]